MGLLASEVQRTWSIVSVNMQHSIRLIVLKMSSMQKPISQGSPVYINLQEHNVLRVIQRSHRYKDAVIESGIWHVKAG
jgi:hypothetical protein